MSSAESVRGPDPERDPSLPQQDIRFTLADRRDFHTQLAAVFADQRAVEAILRSTTFSRGRIPAFAGSSAEEVWGEILLQLELGAIHAGNFQLLSAVIRPYPGNAVFRRLADTYLRPVAEQVEPASPAVPAASDVSEAAAPSTAPEAPAAAVAPVDQPTCHVIVRASTEETREQATRVLQKFGLEPREEYSTAHAVSYRVNSASTERVRTLLASTDLGWTVVAPELRDYLLHRLYIEGPDGRQFRITDAPAQQTVANLAAEVVDQYGSDFPDASRPTVVDRVAEDGQGHRLDPNATLDDAQVRDGDRMRVGFQARAAAVNPLDRQDALYRVRNQIVDFSRTRDQETAFVARANSTLLPTEYELEFTQASFGPPASPGAAPGDIGRHTVLIQLGSDFPETPPGVYWLTQIFHPNVFPTYESEVSRGQETQMGLVCLGALQESYLPSLHFGSLCQMLMDIAGFRNYSLYVTDGTLDSTGSLRRRVDFYDPDAARWAGSAEGQRRIRAIKGSPADVPTRSEQGYRNVIERVGDE